MKGMNYILLGMAALLVSACSSDSDLPEEHVFTPDATLSLSAGVPLKVKTKAAGAVISEETKQEDAIHVLDVLVFSGHGNDAVYQTGAKVTATETEAQAANLKAEDIPVEAGEATIVVLANVDIQENDVASKTLKDLLALTRSLDNETLNTNGLSMSSALIETNLLVGYHNIFGTSTDFPEDEGHTPQAKRGDAVKLVRHVAQINLKSVEIKEETGATFDLKEVFVANVKGLSRIATNDTDNGVEVASPTIDNSWWYGDCEADTWNGVYKLTTGGVKKDFLAWTPIPVASVSENSALETQGGYRSVASFYVYENRQPAELGYRTLLVLKGDYTYKNGRKVEDRYYTISVNDPDMKGSTSTEIGTTTPHNFVKRNYRYNISLTIKSSGSDRPYDPASEACMDVAITVADWNVVEQDETLD